ncbi:MAG: vacuolar family H+-ATPase subunit H [Lachnospiraceae bacterium]|nr:vacuolar family H+-ATPase subunit H [Lachnospiraceae bacterium]MDE6661843.1 vacuolar family H+-ATPase subunit H [Lachnospiraceae bacterium]
MSSKIEQLIDEIEDYIDGCKYQPLSKVNILVNKEEIDELLRELRMKTPDEIKRYQKIISNKEAILNDARAKAETIINEATVHTNELINEHEIMQQAYAQANEVVTLAAHQAQEILDNATNEANGVRSSAMQYLDDMLSNLENIMTNSLNAASAHYESFYNAINGYNEVVKANRAELKPHEVEQLLKEVDYDDHAEEAINLDIIKS